MRIIFNEIKKIFNFKTIIIIGMGSILLFKIFAAFYIKYFPNGSPPTENLEIITEMRERYGDTLSENEAKDFKENFLKEKENLADEYIRNHKDAKKLGIKTYKELTNNEIKDQKRLRTLEELYDKMIFEENSKEFWIMNSLPHISERVEGKYFNGDEGTLERYNEIQKREQPLISSEIIDNYDVYIEKISIIVIFAVMVSVGTIFVKDRNRKVDYLQYTSKVGRRIDIKKMIAGSVASLILTTIILSLALGLYFLNCGTTEVFHLDINSVVNDNYIIDITYRNYVLFKVFLIYIIAISTTLITMGISYIGKSYIRTLCIGIPVFVFIDYITENIILRRILVLGSGNGLKFILLAIIIAMGIMSVLKIKNKKVDILY